MSLTGHLLCSIPFEEPEALQRIREDHPDLQVTYRQSGAPNQPTPSELYQDVTVLCTFTDFPEPGQAPHLQLICLASAGSDHAQKQPIYQQIDVPITTASGIHGPIISEWVIMMMLAAAHRYPMLHEWQRARTWPPVNSSLAQLGTVTDRIGQRLGILGYGSIGRQVARVAQAMGMEVVVFTAHARTTPEQRRDTGYIVPGIPSDPEGSVPSAWFHGLGDRAALHRFLAHDLDYLLVCVPLTAQTRGLVGRAEFDLLARRNAFVINIARGDVLVQSDLVHALHQYDAANPLPGQGLRGAALDVASPEPLPSDNPLWDAPSVIISPHISGMNADYAFRLMDLLRQNLGRLARGDRLLNVINKGKGYASKTV